MRLTSEEIGLITKAIRFIIYARKSTDVEDKQVRSIDGQLSELHEFAKRNGLTVLDIVIERESAKRAGSRRKFNELLSRIEAGEADGILAWHPDRLARNMTDGGRVFDLIDAGKLAALRFPTFWFEPTPQGKFMLAMAFSQSKYYVDALAENTKRGLREKVRRGEYPGLAPIGYLNDRTVKRLVIDPERAQVAVDVFERFADEKLTIEQTRQYLFAHSIKSRTGKPVPNTTVTAMLKNPIYYGDFRYDGDVHRGRHDAIVSKDLFDRVQRVLGSRFRYTPTKIARVHKPFLGVLRCADCHLSVTSEVQKGTTYYRCSKKRKDRWCTQPYIRQEELVGQLSKIMLPYVLPLDWADEMLRRVEADRRHAQRERSANASSKRGQLQSVQRKMDVLLEMRLSGEISPAAHVARKAKFMSQTKTLENELALTLKGHDTRLELLQKWILSAKNLGKTLETGSLSERAVLAKEIFGSNLFLDLKRARGVATKPWSLMGKKGLGDTIEHLYDEARMHFNNLDAS